LSHRLRLGSVSTGTRAPIFDAHLHIVDRRFPLVANQGYQPPPFPVEDYRALTQSLGVVGGAVVAGSFQGCAQGWLHAAQGALGCGFVGVAQLPPQTGAAAIRDLDAAGVRALRFNLHRGMQTDWAALERLAHLAFDTAGWHAELYLGAAALQALESRLATLPAIVIDHLGLERAAQLAVLRLIDGQHPGRRVHVKASGFGRLDFDPAPVLAAIASADSRALVFGTDLPSTRAPRPFAPADLDLLCAALADDELIRATLWHNARQLYRLSPPASANGD
jgi:predicted TIM-barrel fold metal-dependent hydrolase